MKQNKIYTLFILLFFLLVNNIYSQSDYKITQDFKSKQKSFEVAIDYAKSLKELNAIRREIEHFREEFLPSKEMLDKALYPENFNSSFELLDRKLNLASAKLAKITTLQKKVTTLSTNVSTLTQELDRLNLEISRLKQENKHLLTKILVLQRKPSQDAKTIDSLAALVKKLRRGINERDSLILDVMDNIFLTEQRMKTLNATEKKEISSKIHGTNLLQNIENLLDDNIKMLDAGVFNPQDLEEMRKEQNKFKLRWEYFSPKLANIYASNEEESTQLSVVDSLVDTWGKSIDQTYWNSINNVFAGYNINLAKFNNSESFQKSLIAFIAKHLDKESKIKPVENHQDYVYFQTAWTEDLGNKWLPILIKEKMYTESQKKEIDDKLDAWGKSAGNATSIFIYILAAVVILLAVIIFFLYMKKSKKRKHTEIEVELKQQSGNADNETDEESKLEE